MGSERSLSLFERRKALSKRLGLAHGKKGSGRQVLCLVDRSGSMAGGKLDAVKAGVGDFASDAMKRGYSVGLISFSDTAQSEVGPTQDRALLQKGLDQLQVSGGTDMASGLLLVDKVMRPPYRGSSVVVATDGFTDQESALKAASRLKARGVRIVAIGTSDADQDFLKQLASKPEDGRYVSTPKALRQAIADSAKLLPPLK